MKFLNQMYEIVNTNLTYKGFMATASLSV